MKHEYPIHLDIESTNACQLSCSICPRPRMTRPVGFMKWELFKKIIDESTGKVKTCYLHQIGEPLLHRDIIKFINYAENAGIKTSISTNGLALIADKSMALLDSKLGELSLCIDSLDKKTYDKIRIGSDYHIVMFNVMQFLQLAKENNNKTLKITIQLIKTEYNINETDKFKEFFNAKCAGLNHEILIKEFSTFAGSVKDVGINTAILRFKCGKPFNTMTINWDGSVVLCCRDYNNLTVIDNVNNKSISDIWHGPEYILLREKFKNKDFPEFCRSC